MDFGGHDSGEHDSESGVSSEVEELSESACWALLRDVPIGRIALQGARDIEVFPVNFVVDDGTVVFRTAHGTKLALIGDGVRCTFEADDIDVVERLVWSVVIKGAALPVARHDAIAAAFDLDVPTWQDGPKPTYVRIRSDVVSGRRFPIVTD